MDVNKFIIDKYNVHDLPEGCQPIQLPIAREDLSALFCELGYKVGAEIGVESGRFSKSLCENNPGVKHYAVDAWQAYKGYRDHVNQEKLDRFKRDAEIRLAEYNCTIIQAFSLDAVKQFENNSLDYVYIDGNHDFQNCCNDIVEWGKKVRPGGIISGHDFDPHRKGKSYIHVNECVTAYCLAYDIKTWFLTSNKTEGLSRSFLWVKS